MAQHKLNDYYVKDDKVKQQSKTDEKTEIDESTKMDKKIGLEKSINQLNESSGVVEVKYGDETYNFWTVKLIKPFIIKSLKEKRPFSLTIPELNKIDITIFDNNKNEQIPVEIQRTPTHGKSKRVSHTEFENVIRKQLEDNIETYGICWFFFDAEYLRYLQSGIKGNSSINLIWLIKLIREEKLKVFVIKYDGVVRELTTKDFDFLKGVSQMCPISYDNDERILNRNKLKIYHNVIKGYNFIQEEVDNFYEEFYSTLDNKYEKHKSAGFFVKSNNERCKLYGYILHSIGNLKSINNTLDMNIENMVDKQYITHLGIFEIVGNRVYGGQDGNNMRFVDKFDICKYFPGYLRQEKHWLTYKGNEIVGETFRRMCRGDYVNAPTLFD